MPVESPPERGALWLDNWMLAATVANNFGQQTNYPTKSLLNQLRSDTWRSPDITNISGAVFDLGQIRTPTAFAIVEANFSNGTTIQLLGADNSLLTTNVVSYNLPLYPHDATGKIMRWYLGTPTSGTIGTSTNPADAASARGRQFWCVRLLPGSFAYNVTDDFFEIGVVWLGQYVPIRPWDGCRIKPKDPSVRSLAYGRAQWSDPLTPYREVEVQLGGLTFAAALELEAVVRAQGPKHAIVDMYGWSTDPILKRGGCLYGYFAKDPVDLVLDGPDNNELSISFEEASG